MDPQNPAPPVATTAATSAAVSAITAAPQLQPPPSPPQTQPSPQPQPQQQPAPPSSATATPPISTPLPPSLNPNQNPNPNPRPSTPLPPHQSPLQHSQSLSRPPTALTRPWQQSHLAPLSSSAGISSSPSLYSSSSPPVLPPTSAPSPRGGVAIGVPAHRPSPSPSQSASFSPSYGHFAGLGRSGVNIPEPPPNSSASQVRPSMQGAQGIGMLGSLSSSSQMRPGGVPTHHQQRPGQSSLRPVSSPSNQLPSSQNYQGHSLLRVPPAGSPGSPSPSTSQSVQSLNQPWLASGSQGKPPLPSPSYRQPVNPQSLQQRSHIPPQPQPQLLSQSQLQSQQQQQQPQSHPLPMTSQQHVPTLLQQQQQQQPLPSQQAHEHYSKQIPPSRVPQALSHQQQITRVQASASTNQKLSTPPNVQPNTVQSGSHNRIATVETDESSNRILSKRSIHELVSQVDPSERLDPEVEDILIDIADDFIESITTFGCSLAKHRKSTTLEAKDILLHLERNWNITLPGFGSDEIKTFRKPLVNDIHKERLAAIKKSMLATETATTRNPGGQASGNAKGNLVKTSTNFIGSPNVKT